MIPWMGPRACQAGLHAVGQRDQFVTRTSAASRDRLEMARPEDISSNELFETLENWNTLLKHDPIRHPEFEP